MVKDGLRKLIFGDEEAGLSPSSLPPPQQPGPDEHASGVSTGGMYWYDIELSNMTGARPMNEALGNAISPPQALPS
jgi:hypothetical protein